MARPWLAAAAEFSACGRCNVVGLTSVLHLQKSAGQCDWLCRVSALSTFRQPASGKHFLSRLSALTLSSTILPTAAFLFLLQN